MELGDTMLRDFAGDMIEYWRDGWGGKAVVALIASIAVGCVALVLLVSMLIYKDADSLHLHEGTIKQKQYSPMWTQQQCNQVGKVLVCTPIIHPESWTIKIEGIDDRGRRNERTVSVSENHWNQLQEGEYYKID